MRAAVRSATAQKRSVKTCASGSGSLERAQQTINACEGDHMSRIVYIVGAIVIVLAVLSFFGLR